VSCHPIASPARTHEQRASAAGWAHKYFGIVLIDRFHLGIRWIAVEQPCRQLSPKRSKPSQFIFIRVQDPVSEKSRNRPQPASRNQAQQGWTHINWRAKTEKAAREAAFSISKGYESRVPIVTAAHASEPKSRRQSFGTQVFWDLIDRQILFCNQIVSYREAGSTTVSKEKYRLQNQIYTLSAAPLNKPPFRGGKGARRPQSRALLYRCGFVAGGVDCGGVLPAGGVAGAAVPAGGVPACGVPAGGVPAGGVPAGGFGFPLGGTIGRVGGGPALLHSPPGGAPARGSLWLTASTSKISSAFAGIGPRPFSPYASSYGMNSRRSPPRRIPSKPVSQPGITRCPPY